MLQQLLGASPALAAVRDELSRLLARPAGPLKRLPPVLIQGETGTGKGLVAHAIHHYALIAVMCELMKMTVPAGFGVAPSTLKYHAAQPKAA